MEQGLFVGADASALQHVFDAFVHNDYLLMTNFVENIFCKRKQFSFILVKTIIPQMFIVSNRQAVITLQLVKNYYIIWIRHSCGGCRRILGGDTETE